MQIRFVGGVLACAVLAEMALLACSKKSYNDFPTDGDDASTADEDGGSIPLGDDSFVDDFLEPLEAGEASGPPCTIPSGTYTVTYTPVLGDAGSDGGGACFASTSTFVYPPPSGDGSVTCEYTVDGNLPVCSIAFDCSTDDGEYTTKNNGFIQVLNGEFGGQDTKEVFLDIDAGFPLVSCNYTLDYTLQQ